MLETLPSTSGLSRGAEVPWNSEGRREHTHLEGSSLPVGQGPPPPHAWPRDSLVPARGSGGAGRPIATASSRFAPRPILQDKELSPAPIPHLCPAPALPGSPGRTEGLVRAARRLGGFGFFFPLKL